MKIQDVVFSVGRSGYFNKDLLAVKAHGRNNGSFVDGAPLTPGYQAIVQPGQIISVMLRLADGSVAIGECADVIFSGLAGRDPLFVPAEHLPLLEGPIRAWLTGRDVTRFRANAEAVDRLQPDGERLHTALRYGLTQALLAATALAGRRTQAEVIVAEYDATMSTRPIDLLASCHRGDALQLDRVIMKQAALLPHGSFTMTADLGEGAIVLTDYARSVARRIQEVGAPGYRPRLHFDLYGTLGDLFRGDADGLADYIVSLEQVVAPFDLLLESPIVAATQAEQLQAFAALRSALAARGARVKLIADEWCNTLEDIRLFAEAGASDYVQIKTPDLGGINNTIEAVLFCRAAGLGCCLGGTANETDLSARITAQIALATGPDFMMTKPGIGADEGIMILTNEMVRTLALIAGTR